MNRHGTDKLYVHHYDEEYERHFGPFRDEEFVLLEIGVGGYAVPGRGGESLRVWKSYFPRSEVIGIDIEDKSFLDGDGIRTFRGDQSDPTFLRSVHEVVGPFRVIIDDGSHVQDDILASFRTLFPLLEPGGIYVIEDLATAYDHAHGGSPDPLGEIGWEGDGPNAIRLIQSLLDGLHWRSWKGRGPSEIQTAVKSVHVSKELAFIYKH